jgi:hypothetical protein
MGTMTRKKAGAGTKTAAQASSSAGTTRGKELPATMKTVVRRESAGTVGVKKVTVRKPAAGKAVTRILSAANGARTLTHRQIKQAVEKVFEERYGTDG